jgi:hypothetical protein
MVDATVSVVIIVKIVIFKFFQMAAVATVVVIVDAVVARVAVMSGGMLRCRCTSIGHGSCGQEHCCGRGSLAEVVVAGKVMDDLFSCLRSRCMSMMRVPSSGDEGMTLAPHHSHPSRRHHHSPGRGGLCLPHPYEDERQRRPRMGFRICLPVGARASGANKK